MTAEGSRAAARDDRAAARETLAAALRIGEALLANGATTDDVETAVLQVAEAGGLTGTQVVVQFAIISISWSPGLLEEPITAFRLVRNRDPDYGRLALAGRLLRDLRDGKATTAEALDRLAKLSSIDTSHGGAVTLAAAATSAAASTVLFGGLFWDAIAAAVATLVSQPLVRRIRQTGLQAFFQNVLGPAVAGLVAVLLVAAGLPVSGALVVTGAILIFLPGGALVAGMRDLIDGSIVSGTARAFEALMLGAAVAIGIAIPLAIGAYLGVVIELDFESFPLPVIALAAAAAAVACAAFAVRNAVPRFALLSAGLLGAVGVLAQRLMIDAGIGNVLATTVAAVVIGSGARVLARRSGAPAAIWIGAASLPLLPGLLLVEGLTAATQGGGVFKLIEAIVVGVALGIGAALGDILVATVRQVNRAVVQPVVTPAIGAVGAGIGRVTRPRRRSTDEPSPDSTPAEASRDDEPKADAPP